jgi:hypothetical protein
VGVLEEGGHGGHGRWLIWMWWEWKVEEMRV